MSIDVGKEIFMIIEVSATRQILCYAVGADKKIAIVRKIVQYTQSI
jgi:hypothetical protein